MIGPSTVPRLPLLIDSDEVGHSGNVGLYSLTPSANSVYVQQLEQSLLLDHGAPLDALASMALVSACRIR